MSCTAPGDADSLEMLRALGLSSVSELFDRVPEGLRLSGTLTFTGPMSEPDLVRHLRSLAGRNLHCGRAPCFAGGGVYDHYSPAVVDAMVQRGELLTAYTPYQPEMSQGFLTAMFEFQTLVCELYGLDVANASLYDAGTGVAEAVFLAQEATRRDGVVIAGAVNPRYVDCLRTVLSSDRVTEVTEVAHRGGCVDVEALERAVTEATACVVVQQPSFLGLVEDVGAVVAAARAVGARTVVCADPIAMGILESPGALGADIAVGEGQGLGLPMSWGGPLLGLLAATEEFTRILPGRVVGRTVDRNGKPGFVLTLQTREQHIRREKATSNICTNQGLCALAATVYLAALGPRGLRRVASLCVVRANQLRDALRDTPLRSLYAGPVFKEFAVASPITVPELQRRLGERGFTVGGDISRVTGVPNSLLLCATENRTVEEIGAFAAAVREVTGDAR